jgi:photosystem II stability/assembly factor-like uncharacterized protein
MYVRARTVLFTVLALTASTVSAGVNVWTTNGPEGVGIEVLAIDPVNPATLYAGTYGGGALKSTDSGGTWTPANRGLTNLYVYALAIDPSTPTSIYAGTGEGVFKSTDSGRTWAAVNTGLTDLYVTALAIDPATPATLYAGTYRGLFKSTNSGDTWASANTGLGSPYIDALAIDPAAPATLYAGTVGPQVFKSTDSGGTWTYIWGDPWGYGGVFDLAMNPRTPTTLYAGTDYGLFECRDSGCTAIDTELIVVALAIDPANPATLYAGKYGDGVIRSTDAGSSWTAMNEGLTNPFVNALAVDPATPARIYAGTRNGIYQYLRAAEPCVPGATTLCLNGGRFGVTTEWSTSDGRSGTGQAVALTEDTGYFTFFDAANVEVLVKVLNGCGFNERFWTFAGGLTDVNVVMTVVDSQTGDVKTYTNPQGTLFQPIQDTDAFATCSSGAAARVEEATLSTAIASGSSGVGEVCVADSMTLCLNNARYKVQSEWFTRDGATGAGQVIPLTSDTGAFWFFSPNNVEMVVKVLNGCGLNSRYWTFAGGLTDVNVILTVSDTQTGAVRTYINPQGTPFEPIQDTSAFATCP